jgi:hypothetical protein
MSERVRELEKHLDVNGLPFGLRCAPIHVEAAMARGMSEAEAWTFVLGRLGWRNDDEGGRMRTVAGRKDDVIDPMGGPTSRGSENYADRVLALKRDFELRGVIPREALERAINELGGYGAYADAKKNGIATEAPARKAEPVGLAAAPTSALRRLSDMFVAEVERLTDAGKSPGDAYDLARRNHPDLHAAYVKATRTNRDGSRG